MARKKAPVAAKPKATRRKTKKTIGKPDTSVLAHYSPTDGANSHPNWVKTQFPTYIVPHAGHEMTAVREFTHGGHVVKIITTYRVEVDGTSDPSAPFRGRRRPGFYACHAVRHLLFGRGVDKSRHRRLPGCVLRC